MVQAAPGLCLLTLIYSPCGELKYIWFLVSIMISELDLLRTSASDLHHTDKRVESSPSARTRKNL